MLTIVGLKEKFVFLYIKHYNKENLSSLLTSLLAENNGEACALHLLKNTHFKKRWNSFHALVSLHERTPLKMSVYCIFWWIGWVHAPLLFSASNDINNELQLSGLRCHNNAEDIPYDRKYPYHKSLTCKKTPNFAIIIFLLLVFEQVNSSWACCRFKCPWSYISLCLFCCIFHASFRFNENAHLLHVHLFTFCSHVCIRGSPPTHW